MAYKVVCTKCGKPVKVKVGVDGKHWDVCCNCLMINPANYFANVWKIEESGVIHVTDKLKYCSGCYENIYNGQNAKECWSLKSAKLVMKKKVGINDVPPWNHIPIKCLSCYHETGYVMISTEDNRNKNGRK